MRVALVHDSLTQSGGAERVLEVLHELFPSAPVFVLVMDESQKTAHQDWDIRTSWLQKIYACLPRFQYLFPLIPLALQSWKFDGYDVVVSSSSSFAKNIKVPDGCTHINYCHTPTRFLWLEHDYLRQELPAGFRPFSPLIKILLHFFRKWDYAGAQKVDFFVANSLEVKKRIRQVYNRDAEVIYPPINAGYWKKTAETADYFLVAGRLQPHKGNERIIRLLSKLRLPLHVAGTGRQEKHLKLIAGDTVRFLGRVSDEELRNQYSGALALIYPQVEDFGLMPLEAAGCGTPTLALGKAGSLETVVPGETGELFAEEETDAQLEERLKKWDKSAYRQEVLEKHARNFDQRVFKEKISAYVSGALERRLT